MRFGFTPMMIVAAALVAAAPAHAQRASLADRVAALEAQAANPQANMDLLNQINQLRTQVQDLQGTVEQLQHENDQLKQTGRDQYLDLDGRLQRLEGGAAPVSSAAPAAPLAPAKAVPKSAAAGKQASAAGERAPTVRGDSGSLAQAGDERAAYEAALNTLKAGDYVASAQQFQSFLDAHPNGVYAPNAMYWLGESYYVTHNFPLAEGQFRTLVDRYPTHDKAAGGLLKLGMSQYGEGDADAAKATLNDVIRQYPGSDAARRAADQLQSIKLDRLH